MKIILTFIVVIAINLFVILFSEYWELENTLNFMIEFMLFQLGLGLILLMVNWLVDNT